MQLKVILHKDRSLPGFIIGPDFVARCLAKSDNIAAKAHGNPTRDQMLPFGDLPVGTYTTVVTAKGQPERTYGPNARLILQPISGNGKVAVETNGRYGLQIHGGDLSSTGQLRPTHGCLRVDNMVMQHLLKDGPHQVEVVEVNPVAILEMPS